MPMKATSIFTAYAQWKPMEAKVIDCYVCPVDDTFFGNEESWIFFF